MSEPDRHSPEDEGIPPYADDTSSAEDTGVRPPVTDSPAALPTDGPLGEVPIYGTTAEQTLQGESLERKLAREESEDVVGAESDEVGRMIAPDEGFGTDEEPQPLVWDTREHDGMSAEESAMHLLRDDEEEPPEDMLPPELGEPPD